MMIELIGTIVVVMIWLKGIMLSISAIPVVGLGGAGVMLLVISFTAFAGLGIIWNGYRRS